MEMGSILIFLPYEGIRKCTGSLSDLVIHWHMVNQDESILLAGLI